MTRRSANDVLMLLQRIESAAKLYDCEMVKFSMSEIFFIPVLSLSLFTFISKLLLNDTLTIPDLPSPTEPKMPLEKWLYFLLIKFPAASW